MGSPTNLNKILLCQLVNQTFQDILPMMSSVPLLCCFQILSKEENEIMDSIYLQIESAKIILVEIYLHFAAILHIPGFVARKMELASSPVSYLTSQCHKFERC